MGQQGRESSVESGLQGGGSGLGWSEGRLLPLGEWSGSTLLEERRVGEMG